MYYFVGGEYTLDEVNSMMKEAKYSGNGLVSYEQFLSLVGDEPIQQITTDFSVICEDDGNTTIRGIPQDTIKAKKEGEKINQLETSNDSTSSNYNANNEKIQISIPALDYDSLEDSKVGDKCSPDHILSILMNHSTNHLSKASLCKEGV